MDNTVIRKAFDQDMKGIMELIISVFNVEQAIPPELIPIPDELTPHWWCADEGGEITGFRLSASWIARLLHYNLPIVIIAGSVLLAGIALAVVLIVRKRGKTK